MLLVSLQFQVVIQLKPLLVSSQCSAEYQQSVSGCCLQLRLLFRLREVADGMSYLHNKTVVHGDLKSGNVLLTVSPTSPYGRTAKITDFGLSRAMATGQTHRSTHTLGTVRG